MKISNIQSIKNMCIDSNFCSIEFEVIEKGSYTCRDAEWNYKDTLHSNFVHSKFYGARTILSDDFITSVHIQKIFGIKFPMTLVQYEDNKKLVYYSSLLFFLIIVETTFNSIDEGSMVITKYTVFCPVWASFLLKIIKYITLKNYKTLMSEDLPLRNRRGYLRSLGYSYSHDTKKLGWLMLSSISENNVIANHNDMILRVNLNDVNDGTYNFGIDNHIGIRLIRHEDIFKIYPRMCLHEGASLDMCKIENGSIYCPWHGKKISALKIFNLNEDFIIHIDGRKIKKHDVILEVS